MERYMGASIGPQTKVESISSPNKNIDSRLEKISRLKAQTAEKNKTDIINSLKNENVHNYQKVQYLYEANNVRNHLKEMAIERLLEVGHRKRLILPVRFGQTSCFTIDLQNTSNQKDVFRIIITEVGSVGSNLFANNLNVVSRVDEWQHICKTRGLKKPTAFENIVDPSTMSLVLSPREVVPLCFKYICLEERHMRSDGRSLRISLENKDKRVVISTEFQLK